MIHKKIEEEGAMQAEVDAFIRRYPHIKVLLKKGDKGSAIYFLEQDTVKHISRPAYSFSDFPDLKLVDTTGAGDCFTGAFALKMLEGTTDYNEALDFANKVGFLCITKFGAGPSVPYLSDVERVFKH